MVELSEHPVEQMRLGGGVPVAGAVAAIGPGRRRRQANQVGRTLAEIESGLLARQTCPTFEVSCYRSRVNERAALAFTLTGPPGPGRLDWVAVAIRDEGLR